MFHYSNKKEKISRTKPLKPFATVDIETITLKHFDSMQIPVVISSYIPIINVDGYGLNNDTANKLFIIDCKSLEIAINNKDVKTIEDLVNKLWKEYLDFIITQPVLTIFAHNLGSFDGIFLYKGLLKNVDKTMVKSLIDEHNKFISITYTYKTSNKQSFEIIWKDSYRIFPISLKDLCQTFLVKGKLSDYNLEFNDISIFLPGNLCPQLLLGKGKGEDKLKIFLEYSLQDTYSLFMALLEAQHIYFNQYQVDITDSYSTSTLSLEILRSNFLKIKIPIMSQSEDSFIRRSYYGGATDIYKGYGKDLHYYDVNSLYPHAMLKHMPLTLKKVHNDMKNLSNKDLENFFGFIECNIECPVNVKLPFLPYRVANKTIYSQGKWSGVYFSEEIKEALKHGYKIEFVKGYEYSKYYLFNQYIKHFYNIKKNSVGAERFIAKMHLNQFYGYFGRKQELLETVNINKEDLHLYLTTRIIKADIEIDENTITLLMYSNLNDDIMLELKDSISLDIKNIRYSNVKSNVGIASAVTAYARIHMIPFKLNNDVYYSDTDSIFVGNELHKSQIGTEIGLMKDELNGLLIKEAYFLGIKQYGYYYIDSLGNKVEKSVFSGVTRDSLNFNEVKHLFKGGTLIKETPNRFFKSLKYLTVSIKTVKIILSRNSDKKCVHNQILPLKIDLLDNQPVKIIKFLI